MTEPQVVVSMAIVTSKPDEIARSIEAMSRAAAGLALEGMTVSVNAATVEDEETE